MPKDIIHIRKAVFVQETVTVGKPAVTVNRFDCQLTLGNLKFQCIFVQKDITKKCEFSQVKFLLMPRRPRSLM